MFFLVLARIVGERSHLNVLDVCPRPLWVITSAAARRRSGLLATWVQPASLDEDCPLALCALAPHHLTTALLMECGHCYLHLLRRDQLDLAVRFGSRSGRDVDKFVSLDLSFDSHGVPRLEDCLARVAGQKLRHVDAGDRILMWLELHGPELFGEEMPLSDHELFSRIPGNASQHACRKGTRRPGVEATPDRLADRRDQLVNPATVGDVWRCRQALSLSSGNGRTYTESNELALLLVHREHHTH